MDTKGFTGAFDAFFAILGIVTVIAIISVPLAIWKVLELVGVL